MFDIVAVGHLCIDSILLPHRQSPFVALGGSAAYVTLAARRLESRVALITKFGGDFPEAYLWLLEQEGIGLLGSAKAGDAQTTHYELKYSADLSDRTLSLKNKAPPLKVEDLPHQLRAFAIHLAPIADEINYEIAQTLKKQTDVISLDPQGMVRMFDGRGDVALRPPADQRILDLTDIYKSSKAEVEAITGKSDLKSAIEAIHDHGVKIVIITSGAADITFSTEGIQHNIPACTPAEFVDPTGAGDAFIGGFLAEYVNDANILRCACVGAAAASFVVEGVGPTSLGGKPQVYQRARALYEKEVNQP